MNGLVAEARIDIDAPAAKVWEALVNPAMIREYMFGTNVVSDWQEGAPIVWRGEWQGRTYEDKGVILQFKPERVLQYTHFSPLSGQPDVPEDYHTVTVELSPAESGTSVRLTQDNNATEEEREHSAQNWQMMLGNLKGFVEK